MNSSYAKRETANIIQKTENKIKTKVLRAMLNKYYSSWLKMLCIKNSWSLQIFEDLIFSVITNMNSSNIANTNPSYFIEIIYLRIINKNFKKATYVFS